MSRVLQSTIQSALESYGFTVVAKDCDLPWGGFSAIYEDQAQAFANRFFESLDVQDLWMTGKLSPKILMVNPGSRLSWQYHRLRGKIWQVYRGIMGVVRSDDDVQGAMVEFQEGAEIRLAQGERHRLIGLSDSGRLQSTVMSSICNPQYN